MVKAVSFGAKSDTGTTTLLCRGENHDPRLLAVTSDAPLYLDVPVLDLNDAAMVADFIEKRFLT